MTTTPAAASQEPVTEPCWRCGAAMEWRHGTFQCPRCRFKIGCCEGVTGECRESGPTGSRQPRLIETRRIRADEWRRWRDTRLRLLREEASFFSSRYEDAVREPESTWRDWAAQAADGVDKALFVAEDDDGWLGVVGGFRRHDPSEVQLISMWVDPRARGRGAAQSLIRAVATWGRDAGARRIVLFVQEVNAPGQALYLKAGFHPTGDRMPVGIGRPGFKLVFAASVDDLLAD